MCARACSSVAPSREAKGAHMVTSMVCPESSRTYTARFSIALPSLRVSACTGCTDATTPTTSTSSRCAQPTSVPILRKWYCGRMFSIGSPGQCSTVLFLSSLISYSAVKFVYSCARAASRHAV